MSTSFFNTNLHHKNRINTVLFQKNIAVLYLRNHDNHRGFEVVKVVCFFNTSFETPITTEVFISKNKIRNEAENIDNNPTLNSNKMFYTAIDVEQILGVSTSTAYREIKKLNDELRKKGYIIISGKVPVKYFMERLYC